MLQCRLLLLLLAWATSVSTTCGIRSGLSRSLEVVVKVVMRCGSVSCCRVCRLLRIELNKCECVCRCVCEVCWVLGNKTRSRNSRENSWMRRTCNVAAALQKRLRRSLRESRPRQKCAGQLSVVVVLWIYSRDVATSTHYSPFTCCPCCGVRSHVALGTLWCRQLARALTGGQWHLLYSKTSTWSFSSSFSSCCCCSHSHWQL